METRGMDVNNLQAHLKRIKHAATVGLYCGASEFTCTGCKDFFRYHVRHAGDNIPKKEIPEAKLSQQLRLIVCEVAGMKPEAVGKGRGNETHHRAVAVKVRERAAAKGFKPRCFVSRVIDQLCVKLTQPKSPLPLEQSVHVVRSIALDSRDEETEVVKQKAQQTRYRTSSTASTVSSPRSAQRQHQAAAVLKEAASRFNVSTFNASFEGLEKARVSPVTPTSTIHTEVELPYEFPLHRSSSIPSISSDFCNASLSQDDFILPEEIPSLTRQRTSVQLMSIPLPTESPLLEHTISMESLTRLLSDGDNNANLAPLASSCSHEDTLQDGLIYVDFLSR